MSSDRNKREEHRTAWRLEGPSIISTMQHTALSSGPTFRRNQLHQFSEPGTTSLHVHPSLCRIGGEGALSELCNQIISTRKKAVVERQLRSMTRVGFVARRKQTLNAHKIA
jgi:hypothetical protein